MNFNLTGRDCLPYEGEKPSSNGILQIFPLPTNLHLLPTPFFLRILLAISSVLCDRFFPVTQGMKKKCKYFLHQLLRVQSVGVLGHGVSQKYKSFTISNF